jgi:hypothetical protein
MKAALIDRIISHSGRIEIRPHSGPQIKFVTPVPPPDPPLEGAGFAPSIARKQTTFPRLPFGSWNLRIDDGICGAESPALLGSTSRQLQSKVLWEEIDCQYSQEILKR